MPLMRQRQSDEDQGVDELLQQEYEQFLSDVEMPIELSMPRSDFDSRIYRIVNYQPLLLNGL